MLQISQFFKRIQGKQAKESLLRVIIQAAIKKYTTLDVPIDDVAINSTVVTLNNISQSARSTIFIKKQTIITEINSQQQIRLITDIK